MRNRRIAILLPAFIGILLFNGCSNTKFLTDDQILYTGRKKIEVNGAANKKEIAIAKEKAAEVTYFNPNNAILGKRVIPPLGLWVYNYKKPEEGQKPGWIFRTFAEEPVLISTVDPATRCRKIESDLFSIGYFNSKSWFELDTATNNPKKAGINYRVDLETPFRINRVVYLPPADSVDQQINQTEEILSLKPGDYFNLENIRNEKRKIAAALVENGYYFFSPDYVEIIADTTKKDFTADLLIRKKRQIPEYALKKYTIDQIRVRFSGYHLTDSDAKDTVVFDGIKLMNLNNYLKPEVVSRSILFRKGDLYSTRKHQGTIPLLNNYGVFEFVRLQFIVTDSTQQKMDLLIDLATKKDVSLNLEANVQSKSSGFAGPTSEIAISHANIARGANRLQFKTFGGFEWQWGKGGANDLGANSYNAGLNSSYIVPRLLLPFKLSEKNRIVVGKTISSLGYEFVNNVRYYRMNSLNASFSYQWKKKQNITHMFTPLKVNIVSLIKTTPEFDSIVNNNPYVKKSFEEQSIIGTEYNFTFDNSTRKSNGFYFQGMISTSGNFIDLLKGSGNNQRPYTILGEVYSQFVKTSVDFRYYPETYKKGFAFRFYAGTGFSYGNSSVMPYIEQFYSGGSNSLRAFTARSLGPGSYKPVEYNGIIDQTGDIKIELNSEYRFPFSKMVYGAFFLETGNVWLLNEDINRPGAQFNLGTFYKQLAVGTGAGLRFDFDFFVLRTDVGLPLRTPYEMENGYWYKDMGDVFSDFRFNLAIGLPF